MKDHPSDDTAAHGGGHLQGGDRHRGVVML
jgi:hypothetical protein